MAGEKKQHMSLNERHNRLLLGLSASQTRPHPKCPPPSGAVEQPKVKMEGRRRLCKAWSEDKDDDIPQFSGITDFDSPSPVERKPSKFEIGRSTKVLAKDDDDGCESRTALQEHYLSQTMDFVEEKPLRIKTEGKVSSRGQVGDKECGGSFDEPVIDGITGFRSHLEEKNTLKVKMGGRRRLCKVSSKDDNNEDDGFNRAANDDPELSRLADFDSPIPMKDAEGESCGGNEIRDILNDLSSRLEFLSIEKKQPPKMMVSKWDSLASNQDEVYSQANKQELPEYESAGSSFSLTSDPFDSSSDATTQSREGGGIGKGMDDYKEEIDVENDSKVDNFLGRGDGLKNAGKGHKKNGTGSVGVKSVPIKHNFPMRSELQDEEDDDFVILSHKKAVKNMERQDDQFHKRFNDSDKVGIMDYRDEKSITLRGPKSAYVLPGKIANMLYPHQRDGLKWLWSLHGQGKGGILGDDMGLGKTMQICGFLAGLFHSCLIKRVMIVAPKTLLPHWIKELSVVGLSQRTREYYGTCAKARQYELQYILQDKGILLTTYDIVRNNVKSLRGDYYFDDERSEDGITWDYMILDEGHLIKNPGTQRAKSLLEIPSAHRIIISGTPIQNNLKELWALFNFCCPELLGDKNWFKDRYESPILRGNDKHASDRDKRIGSTVAKELRERIQPYFLRRLKNEVFGDKDATDSTSLSKKSEIIVWLRLTGCQRQLYEAFLKSELVLSAFDGSPLAAITILKKICDHPLLLTKRAAEDVLEGLDSMLNQADNVVAEKLAMHIANVNDRSDFEENHDNVSCKISFILSLLDNLISEGHCVLIFSQTRKMLNLIQEQLVIKGYEFLRIDGTTKASDRLKIVNDFQEGTGAPIFLLTSQVGGLGLTLTKADRVIVVDPAWNPSTDNQSVDRAYRIGQKKDVLVYRLMTCGTIEEKIYRKQIFKGGLFKTATEHKEQTRYFSQQDLRELFSLPKQGFDVSLTQQQLHEEHGHQLTMDASLKAHLEFLETQGIAGVSHHSLLFSKTAPAPVVQEEEEVKRVTGATFTGNSTSTSQLVRDADGAKYAFNPKDVKLYRNNSPSSTDSGSKRSENEIKERMNRLSNMLANKVLVSKLPDKGVKIQKQLVELKSELDMIQMEKSTEKEVIHLDDLSEELQRVLNV